VQNGHSASVEEEEFAPCESPIIPDEIYDQGRGGGMGMGVGSGRNGYMEGKVKTSQDFRHARAAYSFGAVPTGRGVQYYD
jgi:hypothetical protein